MEKKGLYIGDCLYWALCKDQNEGFW